ncbi:MULTISPECIES: flavodoxin [Pediococcus]|uniref:flavodoxin family protein n=1 Tax=Pediococcus TaxID=1253 RepID=UPI000E9F6C71|nr:MULTISPECIES: flavodoxin [Pediococcus]MCT3029872.1 flavodoxin [Pediococcus parvulus]MDN5574871.1 flavodoxin [Pediococcus sp.]HBO47566.1 flavodoxin [Pediococcus sp.]
MAKKMLIAYYSWSGNTERLAKIIQRVTNGKVFAMKVADGTFSTDMFDTSDRAKKQLETNQLPKLVGELPDVSNYDLVLVGGPVWSGEVSTPVRSFLQQITPSKTKLAPFYTDTGSADSYEKDFKHLVGTSQVVKGLGLTGSDWDTAEKAVVDWSENF